jgi:molybdenum cofactor biosynthesis protein B
MVDFQKRDRPGDREADDGGDSDDEQEPEGHDHGEDGDHDGHDHADHDHHAHDVDDLGIAVLTVSSSRSRDDDPSGDIIVSAVEGAGHEVTVRDLVNDDRDTVQRVVATLVGRGDVDAVVTTGGTGVTPDDVTVEAVRPLFDKRLPGFGELFRDRSREEVGTKVVGTRATAGIADGAPVFCLPGSANAARLGIEEIILEEVGHLAGLARRD